MIDFANCLLPLLQATPKIAPSCWYLVLYKHTDSIQKNKLKIFQINCLTRFQLEDRNKKVLRFQQAEDFGADPSLG